MRVFQLNTYCGVKSTGRIACDIAKLVQREGGQCQIGYGIPDISKDSEPFAYRIGTPLERKIHGAARKLLDAEGYGSHLSTQKLIQKLQSFQPDVIHFHNLHGCYLNFDLLFHAVAEMDVPVVWTLHDCWPFTGHCAYFDYSGCNMWKTGCRHCTQQKNYPVCIGLDGSGRNYRHKKRLFTLPRQITFVAPCEWMKIPLSESFLSHYPVRVIPNGVNLSDFYPIESSLRQDYGLADKKIFLAVASEWDERKGLKYILQAAERMGEAYHFVVIGLDETQMSGLPANVLPLAKTSSTHELAAWYSAADCFLNPTLEDNMPMVNLEALACGTPVVVFRTGGCPEAVTPECGIVVEQGNLDALCKAAVEIADIEGSMRQACIQRAAHFDAQKTFQSYINLYKELCL